MNPNFDLNNYILHHAVNAHEWLVPFSAPLPLGGFLTRHLLMIWIGCGIILMLFLVLYNRKQRVPTGLTNCLECLVQFVRDDIAVPNMGEKDGLLFTPMLCTLGIFILVLNLLGIIPLFPTATSNINVTFSLAFFVFVLLVFGTIARNGLKGMWHALVPSSVPGWLVPMFFVIEVVSVFVRSAALMIRLFANMVAGHMVIIALLGLVIIFGWFVAVPAVVFAVFIYGLEVLIAFLQAYIFILLTAVFIGQMYHPDH